MSQALLPYLTPSGFGSQTTATGSTTPRALPDRANDLGVNVKDFGALGNTQRATVNVTVSLGTPTTVSFSSALAISAGQAIQIPGAGAAGVTLSANIQTVTGNGTGCTISASASTALTASSQTVVWGNDDSAAIAAAQAQAVTLYSEGYRPFLFFPAGYYLIKATTLSLFNREVVGVQGQGRDTSIIVIDPAYSGDVFSWSDLQSTGFGSGHTAIGAFNTGAFVIGMGFQGDQTSTSLGYCLAMYGVTDFMNVRDCDFFFIPGTCLSLGHVTGVDTVGCTRESDFINCKFWNCGTASAPVIDIYSTGASDTSNELFFGDCNVFFPTGDAVVVRNNASASPIRLIKIVGLRIEAVKSGFSALRLGDATYAGGMYGISVLALEIINVASGAYGINYAGAGIHINNTFIQGVIEGNAGTGINLNSGYGSNTINISFVYNSGTQLATGPNMTAPFRIETADDLYGWTTSINAASANYLFFPSYNNYFNNNFALNYHDGQATEGNGIGQYSVDLQYSRTSGGQTATGTGSIVLAGQQNVAAGNYSVVSGYQCQADAPQSFAGGSNVVLPAGGSDSLWWGANLSGSGTPQYTLVVGYNLTTSGQLGLNIGSANTYSGNYGGIIGGNSSVSGNYSFGVGDYITITQQCCFAFGLQADAPSKNRFVQAPGYFSALGDCQVSRIVLKASTTSTSATRLTCDGTTTLSAANLASMIRSAGCYAVKIVLSATDTTATGNSFTWQMPLGILQETAGAATCTWAAGTPTSLSTGTGSGASVTVAADTTYGALALSFTAPNSDTWHIVALVEFVEVG